MVESSRGLGVQQSGGANKVSVFSLLIGFNVKIED